MKPRYHSLDRNNRHIFWQKRAQGASYCFVFKLWPHIRNACDLSSRMDPLIGTSGERNTRLVVEKTREGSLELLLNSSLARLNLRTGETCAIVRDDQL